MNRRRRGYNLLLPATIVLASALTALIVLGLADSVRAQSATSLEIVAGAGGDCVEIDDGDQIEVQLLVENVSDLQTWEVTIVHNRNVLEIVEEGVIHFLSEEPNSNVLGSTEPLPDYNGRHLLGASDLSNASESGGGVLAVLVFEAIGEGWTTIGIPQIDINNDGRTDEGSLLSAYGSRPIGDVNGDRFFDGSVQSAVVAVEMDCDDVDPHEPTDPPTPTRTPPGGNGGDEPTPSGTGPDGTGPDDSDPPDDPGETDGPEESDGLASPGESPGESDDDDGGSPVGPGSAAEGSGGGDGGSSIPAWLVAALLVGGLAVGAMIVTVAVRRSSDTAL